MGQDEFKTKYRTEFLSDKADDRPLDELIQSAAKFEYRASRAVPIVFVLMGLIFGFIFSYCGWLVISLETPGFRILDIGRWVLGTFVVMSGVLIACVSFYAAKRGWRLERTHEQILATQQPLYMVGNVRLSGWWSKFFVDCEAGKHPWFGPAVRLFEVLVSLAEGGSTGFARKVKCTLDLRDVDSDTTLQVFVTLSPASALRLRESTDVVVPIVLHPQTTRPYAILLDEQLIFL